MAQPKPPRDLENLAGTLKVHVPYRLGQVVGYGLALRALAARSPRRPRKAGG